MERKMTDPCCIGAFVVLLLGFIGLGAYFIYGYNAVVTVYAAQGQTITVGGMTPDVQGTFAGIAIGCIFISILLSIGYIFMAKAFPKCMVWGLIIGSVLLFVAIAVAGFIVGSIVLGAIFAVITLFYALILFCCLRGHIDTSIVLVKCTGEFLGAKPQVLIYGVVIGLITAAFSIYWVFGYIGIITLSSFGVDPFNPTGSQAFQIVFWILYLFFTYFFYFATVFLIGASVALWYFKQDKDGIVGTSFKWLLLHTGSITFGSIIITIIRVIRSIVSENSSNPALRLCFAIIMCIFKALEYYLKILNHYATISMAFTGQGYIASAKNAGLLIFSNLGLFVTVDIITAFFFYVGVIVCIGIPTAVSAVILLNSGMNPIVASSLVIYMVIIVLMFSLLIGMTFITTFADALSAVFLFYCMDKKLTEHGITQSNCPDGIKELMTQMVNQQAMQYLPDATTTSMQ